MAEELNISSVPLPASGRSESMRIRIRKTLDGTMEGMSIAGALTMVALLAALVVVLFVGALPAVQKFGIGFLTGTDWNPMEDIYGALPFIYGTIVSAAVALCIAVPMSLGAALFLTRIAPRWLAGPVSFLIELLAAIPSIVYGFWGQKSLIPFLQQTGMPFLKDTVGKIPWVGGLFSGPAAGFSMLAAGIVLAIMVMPIMSIVHITVI